MERLFQSFSQVDASTTRKFGGTGLGLFICKRLAELMGGAMSVESEAGQGSKFHFHIMARQVREDGQKSSGRFALRGKRVFLVHDDAAQHEMFARWAPVWGLELSEAKSVDEADVMLAGAGPYDLLILDYELLGSTDLDVGQAAARLHALPATINSSILMLSAQRFRRASDWEAFGAKGCLIKPLRSNTLLESIEQVFTDGSREKRHLHRGTRLDGSTAERLPLRLLVADDNAINRKVAGAMLKRLGYTADMAVNGLEVLRALETATYDIILLDVAMPEMDGYETSRRIHEKWAAHESDRPRLIALTGYAMTGDRELCLAAGMDDYITKPLQVEDLRAALERSPARLVTF
jgi:CheY-like chemotaxis protein